MKRRLRSYMSNYFIYTGNAYPHKNLKRLIEAIKLLNVNKKEIVKLKIVSGRSMFLERLKKQIGDLNAEKYIEVLGFVEDKSLADLYKNSLAFVFPTLDEGFGLPPMEAINAGTLAIVSSIPVLKEVYKGSVFYFDPISVNSMSNALEQILNMTTAKREQKIKEAQEFLKRYSWSKMAEETLMVYESVFSKE